VCSSDLYTGLLTLALCALARSWRDRLMVLAAAAFYLVAMDWTIVGRAINAVPPFSIVANDKLRFVCVFFLAVVAAKALDQAKKWQVAVAALPLVALAVYLYRPPMRPLDLAGVAAVALFLGLPKRWAAAVVIVELMALNAGFNALVKAKYFRPALPIVEAIRTHAPREPFRVAGLDWVLLPNASAQYGLEDIRGSDPMAYATYDAYLRRFTVQQEGTWVRRVVDAERPELDLLNVRFLLAEPGVVLGGKWRELYRGSDGVLYRNEGARERFFSERGEVRGIRQASPGEFRMRVRAGETAEVRSSQPFGPGWVVEVGGKRARAYAAEGAFLAFRVPAGEWPVRVYYQSLSYRLSAVVSLAGVAAMIFGIRRRGVPLSGVPSTGSEVL